MKRFKYSLQRVMDVREVAVSQCEIKLAESNRALNARRAEHRQCGEDVRQAAEEISAETATPVQPFCKCLAQRAWFEHLADRLQCAWRAAQQESATVDTRRTNLKKAMLAHKVIENLSRRERCTWLELVRQTEQKTMDEVASGTHARRNRTEHPGTPSIHHPASSP